MEGCVPTPRPMAMIVGPPYLSLWKASAMGRDIDGLRMFSADRWSGELDSGCPAPPTTIAEQELAPASTGKMLPARPPVWPFDDTRHHLWE